MLHYGNVLASNFISVDLADAIVVRIHDIEVAGGV
jgi:hypothetical protein